MHGAAQLIPVSGSSTPSFVGWNNSATGSLTGRTPAAGSLFTEAARIGYVTSTTPGNVIGSRHQSPQFGRGSAQGLGGWHMRFRIGTAAHQTGMRAFFGKGPSSAPTNVDPSALTHIVGIGKDATDTNWQIMYCDGTNPSTVDPTIGERQSTKIDTGIPATTNNADIIDAEFACIPASNEIRYKITNVVTGAVSTGRLTGDIIGNGSLYGPQAWVTNNTASAAAGVDCFGFWVKPHKSLTNPITLPTTAAYVPPAEPTVTATASFVMEQAVTVKGKSYQAHTEGRRVSAGDAYNSILMTNDGDKFRWEIRQQDRAEWDPDTKVRAELQAIQRAARGQTILAEFDVMVEAPANAAAVPNNRDWFIVYQIHQVDRQHGTSGSNLFNSIGLSPLFALEVINIAGKEYFAIKADYGVQSTQTSFSPQRMLATHPFERGRRYKVRVEVIDSNGRLASDTGVSPTPAAPLVNGKIHVTIDDVVICNFTGRVGYWCCAPENAGASPQEIGSYCKFGLYAGASKNLTIDDVIVLYHWNWNFSIT